MQGVAFSRDSADWHRSSGRRTREYSLSSLSKEGATDTRIDVSSSLKVEHSDAAKEQYMSLDQSGKELREKQSFLFPYALLSFLTTE